jgi:hypothetical protein
MTSGILVLQIHSDSYRNGENGHHRQGQKPLRAIAKKRTVSVNLKLL